MQGGALSVGFGVLQEETRIPLARVGLGRPGVGDYETPHIQLIFQTPGCTSPWPWKDLQMRGSVWVGKRRKILI